MNATAHRRRCGLTKACLAAVLIWSVSPTDAVARKNIDEARSHFQEGHFKKAAALLERALARPARAANAEVAEIHELLAACRFYLDDPGAGVEQLAAVLLIDSRAKLDPAIFPPESISTFVALRKSLRTRIPNLRRAQKQFDDLEFNDALLTLRLFAALEPPPPTAELVTARKLVAASLLYLDRSDEADTELMRVLRLEPKAQLDPAVFPPATLNKFTAMKSVQRRK